MEILLSFVKPNCRAVFIKSAALGTDIRAWDIVPSFLSPVQPRCLLSLAARFRALQRAPPAADASNSRGRASIAARLWYVWEEKKGKPSGKDGWRYCSENTTKHAFSRYHGIAIVTPLYSYYPLFMNTETYHTPVTSIAMHSEFLVTSAA